VVDQQTADIADALQLRDVALATIFGLSIGYNFGCMIAIRRLILAGVFGVKLSHKDTAEIEFLTDVARATIF